MTQDKGSENKPTRRVAGSILFLLLFLAISWYYDYPTILSKRPQSIHRWRQSDCASITLNYYQHGMKFFRPEVHFLSSDGRTTGYTVGECPLLYYFIAILYKIFGYNDLIYRLVNTVFFFLGLFALYKMLEYWLPDTFWAIAIALFFFTSPVMVYYANNYLTDTTSFAFVLIGWNFFFRYHRSCSFPLLYLAILFFTLAALLKITAAISVVAILTLLVLKVLGLRRLQQHGDFLPFRWKTLLPFFLFFVLILAWYWFAIRYNRIHQSEYFSTRIWPLWDLSADTLRWIRDQFREFWLADYYHISVLILFLVSFVAMVIAWRRMHQVLVVLTVLLFAGVVIFSLLWFYAFGNHDYYIIGLMILPVFVLFTMMDMLGRFQAPVLKSLTVKILFGVFILFNVNYAAKRLDWRYTGWINEYPLFEDLHTVTPYLRSIGIDPEDKVISLPDPTPCYSLYLMNQKGWTERYNFNLDSLGIRESMNLGAEILILTGDEVKQRPYLSYYMQKPIGEYRKITVYSLKDLP